jgi:hypothetical protein
MNLNRIIMSILILLVLIEHMIKILNRLVMLMNYIKIEGPKGQKVN